MYMQYSRLYVVGNKPKRVRNKTHTILTTTNKCKKYKKNTIVGYYRSGLMKLLNTILINLAKLTSFLRISSHIINLKSIVSG